MSMFLWENQTPTTPQLERVPDFPPPTALPTADIVKADKLQAKSDRPEIREVDIEAKVNNIDLELAKNNLLPSLDLEAAPARAPEKFVLGLGYRFGAELRIPILQRRSRGEVMEAQAQADRLVLVQKYREQQVVVDVDNALSAIERAKERVAAGRNRSAWPRPWRKASVFASAWAPPACSSSISVNAIRSTQRCNWCARRPITRRPSPSINGQPAPGREASLPPCQSIIGSARASPNSSILRCALIGFNKCRPAQTGRRHPRHPAIATARPAG